VAGGGGRGTYKKKQRTKQKKRQKRKTRRGLKRERRKKNNKAKRTFTHTCKRLEQQQQQQQQQQQRQQQQQQQPRVQVSRPFVIALYVRASPTCQVPTCTVLTPPHDSAASSTSRAHLCVRHSRGFSSSPPAPTRARTRALSPDALPLSSRRPCRATIASSFP
jgi:exonuclease VII large subunit